MEPKGDSTTVTSRLATLAKWGRLALLGFGLVLGSMASMVVTAPEAQADTYRSKKVTVTRSYYGQKSYHGGSGSYRNYGHSSLGRNYAYSYNRDYKSGYRQNYKTYSHANTTRTVQRARTYTYSKPRVVQHYSHANHGRTKEPRQTATREKRWYPNYRYRTAGSGYGFMNRVTTGAYDRDNGYDGPGGRINRPHRSDWNAKLKQQRKYDEMVYDEEFDDKGTPKELRCGLSNAPAYCYRLEAEYPTEIKVVRY